MRTVVVTCADVTRRDFLAEVVQQHAPPNALVVVKAPTAKDAAGRALARESVSFIVLSLVGGGVPESDMKLLKQDFPKARIIVELNDDDVESAFEMLRLRAFNVVSCLITRTEKLWEIFTKAIAAEPPYGPLIPVNNRECPWGFMSMSFSPGSPAHNDYYFAICPTMKCLGLNLRRVDEMPYQGTPLLGEMVQKAIVDCPIFVVLISSPTLNTQQEVGLALARKKTIIFLRRADGEPIPALLQGQFYVEYSTMTELAMKLFFGLGGNRADLDKTMASTPHL